MWLKIAETSDIIEIPCLLDIPDQENVSSALISASYQHYTNLWKSYDVLIKESDSSDSYVKLRPTDIVNISKYDASNPIVLKEIKVNTDVISNTHHGLKVETDEIDRDNSYLCIYCAKLR